MVHAKGSGAYGTFTVTRDITKYTKASMFGKIGKKTDLFLRFSTVAGERGAADAERDVTHVVRAKDVEIGARPHDVAIDVEPKRHTDVKRALVASVHRLLPRRGGRGRARSGFSIHPSAIRR